MGKQRVKPNVSHNRCIFKDFEGTEGCRYKTVGRTRRKWMEYEDWRLKEQQEYEDRMRREDREYEERRKE